MMPTREIPAGLTSPTALAKLWGVSRQRADQILYADKRRARKAVWEAVRSGRLVKPAACESCAAQVEAIEAHHPDYTRRLDVRWLCRPCHSALHPHGAQFEWLPNGHVLRINSARWIAFHANPTTALSGAIPAAVPGQDPARFAE